MMDAHALAALTVTADSLRRIADALDRVTQPQSLVELLKQLKPLVEQLDDGKEPS